MWSELATPYRAGVESGSGSYSAYWAGAEWRAEAVAWITSVTSARGLRITGEIAQPRIRFWSTLLTVPTDAGLLWFKENCPGQSFEARLLTVLAELVPDHVVPPLAVEPHRGWLLTPDAGDTLHADDLDTWVRVLTEWADVQRRLADHTDRLRAAGVTAMPPEAAPDYVAAAVDRYAARPPGDPAHLDASTAARMRALFPEVERWADQLAATGLPITLDHNDLHAANAFRPAAGEPHLRFFDFGDAVLAHPFCSLLVPVRVLANELQSAEDDPRIRKVTDAYLEVWSDLAGPAILRAAVPAGIALGALNRGESWRRVLPGASPEELVEFGDTATYWLTSLLDDSS